MEYDNTNLFGFGPHWSTSSASIERDTALFTFGPRAGSFLPYLAPHLAGRFRLAGGATGGPGYSRGSRRGVG